MIQPISRITSMYLERTDSVVKEISQRLFSVEAMVAFMLEDLGLLRSGLDEAEDEEKSLLSEIDSLGEKYSELYDFIAFFDK